MADASQEPVTVMGVAIGDRLAARVARVTILDATAGAYRVEAVEDLCLDNPIAVEEPRNGSRLQQAREFIRKLPAEAKTRGIDTKAITSICYSCIGIFGDAHHHTIQSIARSGWESDNEFSPALDLRKLTDEIGKEFSKDFKYAAVNDATLCAIAEWYEGYGKQKWFEKILSNDYIMAYIRVSYGINAGFIFPPNARLLPRDLNRQIRWRNPEFAHNIVVRHQADAKWRIAGQRWLGTCRHHPCCIEGMSSMTSLITRWGLTDLPPAEARDQLRTILSDPKNLDIPAYYIARMAMGVILAISPPKIIIGGALLDLMPEIITPVRAWVRKLLNGYPPYPPPEGGHDFILPATPSIGSASLTGAVIAAATNVKIKSPNVRDFPNLRDFRVVRRSSPATSRKEN